MTDQDLKLDRLRGDVAEILEEPGTVIGDDDDLMDLGLDSMRAMNLAMKWEEDGVPIDFADLAESRTLSELWSLVQARRG